MSIYAKAAQAVGVVGIVAVGFLYLVAGLVAPPWAVGVLFAIWIVLIVVQIRAWRNRPWLVLAMPVLAVLIWLGVIQAGTTFLDWTP